MRCMLCILAVSEINVKMQFSMMLSTDHQLHMMVHISAGVLDMGMPFGQSTLKFCLPRSVVMHAGLGCLVKCIKVFAWQEIMYMSM